MKLSGLAGNSQKGVTVGATSLEVKSLFSRVSAVLLFATAMPAVAARQENCRAIQDPMARLECFDKLPAAPPAANTAPKKNGGRPSIK
jgi:hypothetical protein